MTTREMQEYAWGWFEYHAGQRLVAFRFFLVFLGAVAVALSQSVKDGNGRLSSSIGAFGCFISVAFLMLEIRNEELVNFGRKALSEIEKLQDCSNYPEKVRLFAVDSNRNPLFSHKFWFRTIYSACVCIFLLFAFCPSFFAR
jgi:hypothetical protein